MMRRARMTFGRRWTRNEKMEFEGQRVDSLESVSAFVGSLPRRHPGCQGRWWLDLGEH